MSANHCILCGKDISEQSANSRYCPECRIISRRQIYRESYYRSKLKLPKKSKRVCVICGTDISDRHYKAKYCVPCSNDVIRANAKALKRERAEKKKRINSSVNPTLSTLNAEAKRLNMSYGQYKAYLTQQKKSRKAETGPLQEERFRAMKNPSPGL